MPIYAVVNGETLRIELADNSSASAFADLLAREPLTIQMKDYGGFEKVGPLGVAIPQNNEQITTESGDVILYQGDKIAIYYAQNSWNFTRLGKVEGMNDTQLRSALGEGDVVVTFLQDR